MWTKFPEKLSETFDRGQGLCGTECKSNNLLISIPSNKRPSSEKKSPSGLVAHTVRAYPGLCSIKRLGVILKYFYNPGRSEALWVWSFLLIDPGSSALTIWPSRLPPRRTLLMPNITKFNIPSKTKCPHMNACSLVNNHPVILLIWLKFLCATYWKNLKVYATGLQSSVWVTGRQKDIQISWRFHYEHKACLRP